MKTNKEDLVFDVSKSEVGDIVYYYSHEDGKFFIEHGEVKHENLYDDGVEVYGEGWKQYVSKWFINKVVRKGVVIFENGEE